MPKGLIRVQRAGDFHFVTFSCFHRLAHLRTPAARDLFERSLETMRVRYEVFVAGYIVMPEHVHLLVSEPRTILLAKVLQALKLSVAVQSRPREFGNLAWPTSAVCFGPPSGTLRLRELGSAGA